MMIVEVVYASLQEVMQVELTLPQGATVEYALQLSKVYLRFPETALYPVGIFSTLVEKDTLLSTGDRVEVYRPLMQDPKEKRKRGAKR